MDSIEGNFFLYKLFYLMSNSTKSRMEEDNIGSGIGDQDFCTAANFHLFIQRIAKSNFCIFKT